MSTPAPKKPMSERDRVRLAYAAHCKKHGKPAPRKWTKVRYGRKAVLVLLVTLSYTASAQWTNWSMGFSNGVNHPCEVSQVVSNRIVLSLSVLRTNQIPATLAWEVVTNWVESPYSSKTLLGWSGGTDPNVTTYHEDGWISSNLVATIVWKGAVSKATLEGRPIGLVTRSYVIKQVKEYNP